MTTSDPWVLELSDHKHPHTQTYIHGRSSQIVTWCHLMWHVVSETRKKISLGWSWRWQVLLDVTCLFPDFTPAIRLVVPRMDASIDSSHTGEHYPGGSKTPRWPGEAPFRTFRPGLVSTRHPAGQSGADKPETESKYAAKFQMKQRSWCSCLQSLCLDDPARRFGWDSAQKYLNTHTHTRTLWDHMSRQRDQHMCTRVQAPPLDPTQQSSMQSSLEFTQIAKNTPAREEIPTFRSNRPPLQRQPNNQPLPTRNRPRQYRKTEASESCFSRIDCCV